LVGCAAGGEKLDQGGYDVVGVHIAAGKDVHSRALVLWPGMDREMRSGEEGD